MDIAKIRKKIKKDKSDTNDHTSERQKQEGTEVTSAQKEERPSGELLRRGETGENEREVIKDEKREEKALKKPQIKKKDVEEEKTDEIIEILSFSLLKEEFAFKISQLAEIIRPQSITIVPQLPKYVLGVTSLRGKVIPVLDLKCKLSLTEKPVDSHDKGKILIIKGPKGPIGATIDRVIGVVRVARNEIIPPPSHLTEAELKFIEGIAVVDKRFISIVNMEETIAINSK